MIITATTAEDVGVFWVDSSFFITGKWWKSFLKAGWGKPRML